MDNIDQILNEKNDDMEYIKLLKEFNDINDTITKKQHEIENLDKKRLIIINNIKEHLKIEN